MKDADTIFATKATGDVPEVVKAMAVDEDYEKSFQQCLMTAERAKFDYERLCREMVEKLSTKHLEPFNEVLLEHEGAALDDQNKMLQKFKDKLLNGELLPNLQNSWTELGISNNIAKLEMLKDHYKRYESHNWNIAAMTPEERSLPLRIRHKQWSKRYLEVQIAQQNKQLEELMALNSKQSDCIEEISKQRITLQETMESNLKQQEQLEKRLQQLTEELPML